MVKKSLAVALGAMLVAGSAAAVEVNPGAKGDLLIAPLFMTKGGWQSEFKVINTSVTDSAVAKVVFHAPGRSDEVLDFLIFLSPGDVWTGSVVENADVPLAFLALTLPLSRWLTPAHALLQPVRLASTPCRLSSRCQWQRVMQTFSKLA